MDSKRLSRVEIKNADRGEVSAVFSTFNVVDSDGDVTLPDAFDGNGEVVISAYGHSSWGSGVPVGKGRIRTTDSEAILDGQFFLDTQAGKDTFVAVKSLGDLGQWSYGYDTVDAERGIHDGRDVQFLKKLKVWEVSPVLVGAGVNTRTLSAKGRDMTKPGSGAEPAQYKAAIRPHKAAATGRPWDAAAVVDALPDDASVSDLRSVFAWVDPDGEPESKSSYRFPHHHGVDGPANIRAVTRAIGVLNGARGGAGLPEADRKAVYNHLAAHLRDADREPPELRAADGSELKNYEVAFDALEVMSDALDDALRVGALRARKGKSLSQTAIEAFEWWGEDLTAVVKKHGRLMKLLRDTPREAVAEEFVRFLRMQNGL